MLAAPCKVARVETECAVLEVATAHAHSVDALRAQLGHGGLAAELELSLLAVRRALRAGGRAFVPRATGDTWSSRDATRVAAVAEVAWFTRRAKFRLRRGWRVQPEQCIGENGLIDGVDKQHLPMSNVLRLEGGEVGRC